jgi:hypothetical protein
MQIVPQPISFAFFEYRLDICLPRGCPMALAMPPETAPIY